MIEDEKIGLKISENAEESFWHNTKKTIEKEIDVGKKNIEINEHILKLCHSKITALEEMAKKEKPKDI